MLLNLKRINEGLMPVDDESVKAVSKLRMGAEIFCEFKPKRNMKFHRKYFALLNAVIIHQEHYKTVDNLHEVVKFKGGYYDTIIPLEGKPFIKTKSIAFHSLDNSEFEKFYSIALDECLKLVGDEALNDIIRFI